SRAVPSSQGGMMAESAKAKDYTTDSLSANGALKSSNGNQFSPLGGAPTAGVRVNLSASHSPPDTGGQPTLASMPIYQARQVIRKADLDVRVENVEKAEKA